MEAGQETKDTMETAGTKEKEDIKGTPEMKSTSEEQKEMETKGSSIRQEYIFAADIKLKECRFCRVMIPKKARICPNCKMHLKSHWFLKTIAALFAIAVIGTGSYWLSAYWGLTDGALLPGWAVASSMTVPTVSVTTGAAQAETGTVKVEAADVAAITVTSVAQKADDRAETSDVPTEPDTVEAAGEGTAGAKAEADGKRTAGAKADADGKRSAGVKTDADEVEMAGAKTDAAGAETAGTDSGAEKDTGKSGAAGTEADNEVEKEEADTLKEDNLNGESTKEKGNGELDTAKQVETDEDGKDNTDADDVATSEKRDKKGYGNAEDSAGRNNVVNGAGGEETAQKDKAALNGEASSDDMDENEAAFRADCQQVDYKKLLREQEAYLGTAVMVEAEVICQADGGLFDDNIYYLCVEEDSEGGKRYYIIRDDREADDTLILEGDRVVIYGSLFGRCTVPANLIDTRPTVPAISMVICDLLEE